jgi:hypothetical protein
MLPPRSLVPQIVELPKDVPRAKVACRHTYEELPTWQIANERLPEIKKSANLSRITEVFKANAKRDDVASPVGGRRCMEDALPYAMIGGIGFAWKHPNLLESSFQGLGSVIKQ